jgi:putative ATP-dependent endonuclease of OLD family
MRIVQIRIRNFRCIKVLDFSPRRHNIMIGLVDAGKSSILNALSLALDADTGRKFRPVEEMDFFEGKMLDDEGKPISIEIEVTLSHCSPEEQNYFFEYWEPWNTEKRILSENSDEISVLDDKKNLFAFRITFQAKYDTNEKEIVCIWYFPKFSFIGGGTEYKACPRSDREKVGFFLIPAERDINKALSFTRYSALDKALRHDKISLDQEINKIGAKLQGVGNFLFDNKHFGNLIDEIEDSVERLLNLSRDSSRKLTFEVSGLGHYDIMNILKAFVLREGSPKSYPISNQGGGAKQVIVLATLRMLASRKKSCIIAIEEPEVGLHPYMQRALTRDLLKTGCQTIITTHSTHIAQVASQESLHLLVDTIPGTKVILNTIPCKDIACSAETIRTVRQNSGHFPSELLDCHFAPRVLLVEGPGDREAVPDLLRKLSDAAENEEDLDGLGVAVMPCASKESIAKMAPYFKSFKKDVFALIDNEESTSRSNQDIISSCDCTFLWPKGKAIEKVLLDGIAESTLDTFIKEVTEFGDDYFSKTGSAGKTFAGKSDDVFKYLKKNKTAHRQFAALLPVEEISKAAAQFLKELNSVCSGQNLGKEVLLCDL